MSVKGERLVRYTNFFIYKVTLVLTQSNRKWTPESSHLRSNGINPCNGILLLFGVFFTPNFFDGNFSQSTSLGVLLLLTWYFWMSRFVNWVDLTDCWYLHGWYQIFASHKNMFIICFRITNTEYHYSYLSRGCRKNQIREQITPDNSIANGIKIDLNRLFIYLNIMHMWRIGGLKVRQSGKICFYIETNNSKRISMLFTTLM